MPDLDVILNHLRSIAGESNGVRLVTLADAESAVREARDATMQEVEQALYAGRICADALSGKIAAPDVLRAAIEECRRFPVLWADACNKPSTTG